MARLFALSKFCADKSFQVLLYENRLGIHDPQIIEDHQFEEVCARPQPIDR